MSLRAALAAFLAFPPAAFAQGVVPAAYDARAVPLDDLSRELLTGHGYELRGNGKVVDKIADAPVRAEDMPYLLSRLASARRLKVLLELNILLNRSAGERKLTGQEREAVRALVKQNWAVLPPGTRKDFKSYFTPEELYHLNLIPPRFDRASALLMKDPEPLATAVAPGAAPTVFPESERREPSLAADPEPRYERASEPAQRPKAYFRPTQVLTPLLPPLSLRRPSPYVTALPPEPAPAEPEPAYAPAPATAYAPAPRPLLPAPAPSRAPSPYAPDETPSPAPEPLPPLAPAPSLPPSPAPDPAVAFAPRAAPPAAPAAPPPSFIKVTDDISVAVAAGKPILVENPALGALKPWTPPPASGQAPATAAAPAAPAAPVAPPPAANVPDFPQAAPAAPVEAPVPLGAADVNVSAFAKFVAEGPYGRDDRALLEFLARKAPEFCKPLLLRTVARAVPRIIFDGSRTGWGLRSGGYLADPSAAGSTPLVALSPGPILVERRRGLFGKDYAVLPESEALYAEIGLRAPKVEAAKKGAASTPETDGRWGPVKVYSDRSRRATYSPQQQAGDLLYELLLIGLQREGFGASSMAARTWADTARFLLYARLRDELGHDAFLDPDRRVELRERLERPDEARDRQIGAWASARSGLLDPRRGGPASQLEFERAAKTSCARASLADRLYELARKREAAVRAAAALAESGLTDESAAAAAIKSVSEKESSQRGAAVAMPACAAAPAGQEESLRRSAALLAEAARLERAFRDARAHAGGKDAR